jgi:predicted amidohydrolase
MDCAFLEIEKNVSKAAAIIEEASASGANMICLPECFNTGYLAGDIAGMMKHAETVDGPTVSKMRRLAKDKKVYLVAPIVLRESTDEILNSAVFINDTGEIEGIFSKTHPVGDERKLLRRGTAYPVWNTRYGKIGILICYDICFPETARILALKGAELVFVPAAWRASYYFGEWWDLNIACRALDNLYYIAAVNRCGQCGKEIFAGKTQLASPVGEILYSCDTETEKILYQDIDINRVAREREFNTVLTDRHPEDYGPLLQAQNQTA